jgi:hypothetical protein
MSPSAGGKAAARRDTLAWEYGQFVDVRDVAGAVQRAPDVPVGGHHRVLLCAAGARPAATRGLTGISRPARARR